MTWPGLVNSVYWWLFGWMEPEQIQTLRRILWIGENLVAAVLRPVCCGWPPVRWSLRDVDGRFFTCFKATATAPRPKGPIAGFNCFNPEILPLRFRHLSPPFSLLAASTRPFRKQSAIRTTWQRQRRYVRLQRVIDDVLNPKTLM